MKNDGKSAANPSSERTGLICRIPSRTLTRYALAYSARVPVSVLGTNRVFLAETFFIGIRSCRERPQAEASSSLRPLPDVTSLRGLYDLTGESTPARLSRCVVFPPFVAENVVPECRDINLLPFRLVVWRLCLGSTNSCLTTIGTKT